MYPPTLTSHEEETRQQSAWKLRSEHGSVRDFDLLLDWEFLPQREQNELQDTRLRSMVNFAVSHVPYYSYLFNRLGLSARHISESSDLALLPVLTRNEVNDNKDDLRPKSLPPGERVFAVFSSSGTTGNPARVVMTERSNLMFTLSSQRQFRWFRFDPQSHYSVMARFSEQLPLQQDGTPYPPVHTYHRQRWNYTGQFFETGTETSFSLNNTVEDQLDWIKQQQPAYLTSNAQVLEHLAFASEGDWPVDSLQAVLSIATQMTPDMRTMIENTMHVPVFENYGFNEIGRVALRCPAGRFHVMNEHCLVEIVDDNGQLCKAGDIGHLVVTSVSNLAMPLIRYDAGDMARVVEGPCPCGRTLPSFGDIIGRYRRIAHLPPGTMEKQSAMRKALARIPKDLCKPVRQYQLHQYKDGRFEFRVRATRPISAQFMEALQAAWREEINNEPVELLITQVDDIPRSPGGKFQDFTSDYMPELDGIIENGPDSLV